MNVIRVNTEITARSKHYPKLHVKVQRNQNETGLVKQDVMYDEQKQDNIKMRFTK